MAGMVSHVATSGCIAILTDRLPVGLPEKIMIAVGGSLISHFVLDAIPHGEMKGGMTIEFFIGLPVYLFLAALSYLVKGIEAAMIFCVSGFAGMIPDGLLFLTRYCPQNGGAKFLIRQNKKNHWFLKVWPRDWMFGWLYHFSMATFSIVIFLIALFLL